MVPICELAVCPGLGEMMDMRPGLPDHGPVCYQRAAVPHPKWTTTSHYSATTSCLRPTTSHKWAIIVHHIPQISHNIPLMSHDVPNFNLPVKLELPNSVGRWQQKRFKHFSKFKISNDFCVKLGSMCPLCTSRPILCVRGDRHPCGKWSIITWIQSLLSVGTVECVYWTEPKATCRQCKTPPTAYNMYTSLEGILSACLLFAITVEGGPRN